MSELPKGWSISSLGDVAGKGQYGWTTKASSSGSVKFLRTTDITKREVKWANVPYCEEQPEDLDRFILKDGDVVISRAGSVGFSKLLTSVPEMAVFASYLIRFRPSKAIEPNFLAAYLKSDEYWKGIKAASAGIALANVNAANLGKLTIPVPPLGEQKRIADQLDTLLARVQACNDRFDAIPALLKRFRQTILDAATTGQLTDDWRNEQQCQVTAEEVVSTRLAAAGTRPTKAATAFFANHRPAVPSKGVLPDTWLLTHIGMVGSVSNGSTPSRQEPSYWGGDIPWVSSGEVANGVIRHTREQITSDGFKNSSVRLLPRGSVLMAMIGEGKTRGQSAILDIDACINQNIAGVVPVGGILDSKYLWFWFRREYENTRTKGNGTGPKALNCERVRELEINLPPITEQAEIVRRVEALFAMADRIDARCAAARPKAQRLTPLVLAKAFRGELVQQDPNDESASKLLARIELVATTKPERTAKTSHMQAAKKAINDVKVTTRVFGD